MKKVKRVGATLLATALLMGIVALPASAALVTERMYARIYGGATVSSTAARKGFTGSLFFTAAPATSDGWSLLGDEFVYFRGRDINGVQATEVLDPVALEDGARSVSEYRPYLPGFGIVGQYYRMAIQYADANPYEYVDLNVSWDP